VWRVTSGGSTVRGSGGFNGVFLSSTISTDLVDLFGEVGRPQHLRWRFTIIANVVTLGVFVAVIASAKLAGAEVVAWNLDVECPARLEVGHLRVGLGLR
jgi:hypothetical protein